MRTVAPLLTYVAGCLQSQSVMGKGPSEMCIHAKSVSAVRSHTVDKKAEYTVEEGFTRLPKERSSDMLLHVCL